MTAAADALMGIFGMKRVKPRKCAHCKAEFIPSRMGHKVCSVECAKSIAIKKREKVERAQDRQKRERLKSRADWHREAQTAVNAYVRLRDEGKPCISCGRHHQGQWHAGHYLSRGAHPELALEERNIHRQCSVCNNYLSGNQLEYRNGLLERYGEEFVAWLEGLHEAKKYTIEQLKAIRDEYRQKLRDLKKAREAGDTSNGLR